MNVLRRGPEHVEMKSFGCSGTISLFGRSSDASPNFWMSAEPYLVTSLYTWAWARLAVGEDDPFRDWTEQVPLRGQPALGAQDRPVSRSGRAIQSRRILISLQSEL